MTKRYAMVVGINVYKDAAHGRLSYAEDDADRIRESLLALGFTVYPSLKGIAATKQKVEDTLKKMRDDTRDAGPDSQVVFFFSGHGWSEREKGRQEGEDYLALYETPRRGKKDALALREVARWLANTKVPARFVWLDACRDTDDPDSFGLVSAAHLEGDNFFFATRERGKSKEFSELKGAAFSVVLARHLKRIAESAHGMSFSDLATKVIDEVKAYTNNTQEPIPSSYGATPQINSIHPQKVVVDANIRQSAAPDSGAVVPLEVQARFEPRSHSTDGQTYVFIPLGVLSRFRDYRVRLSFAGFYASQTEVTVEAYRRFAGLTGRAMPLAPPFNAGWSDRKLPMVNVSWQEADAYCRWVQGRLPTEAEWSFILEQVGAGEGWTAGNTDRLRAVGQKGARGLYDLQGNAWEWTDSWLVADDETGEKTAQIISRDLTALPGGTDKVYKGGSYDRPATLTSGKFWGYAVPTYRAPNLGFRCVVTNQDPGFRALHESR